MLPSLVVATAPAIEPVTLAEAVAHLRLTTTDPAGMFESTQSIAPDSQAIAAAYSLEGASADILGYSAVVLLEAGTNGTGGTVDVKLQDSDDNVTFSDVASGAFTQVTTANDNATYEKAYTGGKRYLRVVATVAGAACKFGVSILKVGASANESDYIEDILIPSARRQAEAYLNRALITTTYDMVMDDWPDEDYIRFPEPPLQSVTSVTYYDTANTAATLSAADYTVDTTDQYGGLLFLNDGEVWPSTTLRPYRGVVVRFKAGYGDAASSVPADIRLGILQLIAHLQENREHVLSGSYMATLPYTVEGLWAPYKVM